MTKTTNIIVGYFRFHLSLKTSFLFYLYLHFKLSFIELLLVCVTNLLLQNI